MNLFGIVELSTVKSAIVLLNDESVLANEKQHSHRISCVNKIGAEVGDKVEVSVSETKLARAHYAARFLPLVFIVLGIALSLLTGTEIMRFAIISATILVGFLFTWLLVSVLNCKSKPKYFIKTIIKE